MPTHTRKMVRQTAGLNAANTWGKSGQLASTFWTHKGEGSQIDYVLVRNPCNLASLQCNPLPNAPVIHPTGFRHIPVQCFLPWPKPPQSHKQSTIWTASQVDRICKKHPYVLEQFRSALQQTTASCTADQLDAQLREAWQQCQPASITLPIQPQYGNQICLKAFWAAKRNLKTIADNPAAPIGIVSNGAARSVADIHGTSRNFVQLILQGWQAAARFQRLQSAIRKRSNQARKDKIERQIEEALEADTKGLTYLYKCMNTMRPKNPKRSIHIKTQDGRLQSNASELEAIKAYFSNIFSSDEPPILPEWYLQSSLNISEDEIRKALQSLSSRKALPRGQMPAALWIAGTEVVIKVLYQDFQQRFGPGQLTMPEDWRRAFVVLIPKPGKPPTSPANLRPISLLPAIPKLLARIAAQRIKPYLLAAVADVPQFAYINGRQTADAIDRVLAHCQQIRCRVSDNRFNPFKPTQTRAKFTGGMQLSLDLAKAFDKIPRTCLLRALERILLPEDLISLILYIHDNALMCFSKGEDSLTMKTGSGVRQGCGLAPLLWVSFTVLLFDRFTQYLTPNQISGFADDLHMHWVFDEPRQFRNACAQVGFILSDLSDMGMQVSVDKTVILLALAGPSYTQVTAPYVKRRRKERYLQIAVRAGPANLPIKNAHTYLGVRISYQNFERLTMQYRLQQSWQAFHRLSSFLCSKKIPLLQRLRLWTACVQSVARYGLDSVGLDEVSASKYRSHTTRQLRRIAHSLGHLTHESNSALHARLAVPDPVATLCDAISARVQSSRQNLGHLHSEVVSQRLTQLVSDIMLFQRPKESQHCDLTEVTQVLRIACSCNTCGQQFASFHALRTHIGKSHPEASIALTKADYATRSERHDAHMQHATNGLPQCNKCGKKFSGWAPYMSHFNHHACPVLHLASEAGTSADNDPPACGALVPRGGQISINEEMVPVFQLSSTKEVASTGSLSQLAAHLRQHGKPNRCPECGMQCQPMYIARHACKQHAWIKAASSQVVEWAKQSQIPSNPCQWCGSQYKTSNKAHRNACPVLWMCGQLLHRYSSLTPSSQGALHDYGWSRGASASSRRAQQLPKLYGAESGHANHGGKQPNPAGHAHGQLKEGDQRGRWRGCEGEVAQGAGQRHTASSAQAQRRSITAAGPEELVGGPSGQSGLQPRQGLEGGCQGSGQASPPTGRQPISDPARLPVCDIYEKSQANNSGGHRQSARLDGDVAAFVSGESLEDLQRARSQKFVPATPDGVAELLAHCDSISNRRAQDQAGYQGDCHQYGHTRERPLSIHAVEPRGVAACESGSSSFGYRGGPASSRPVTAADYPPQHSGEVPPFEEADSGDGERCNSLDARNPKQDAGSPSCIPADRPIGSQRGHTPSVLHPAPEQIGPFTTCDRGGQDASRALRPAQSALLQLVLSNPNSFSYVNASLFSILWASSCSQDGLWVCHNGLLKFLRWLTSQRKPQPVWDNMVFRAIMRDWQQPLRPHDPAAFLQHLQPMIFSASEGRWQARVKPDSVSSALEVVQSGHAWPIKMTEVLSPDSPCTLQQLINQWSGQAQVHGLSTLSQFVALQLPRFQDSGHKVDGLITGPWQISLPCFLEHQIRLQWVSYTVHSAIIHEGTHMLQGQIRAVLLESGGFKYITHDGKRATKTKPKDVHTFGNQLYILILERSRQELPGTTQN